MDRFYYQSSIAGFLGDSEDTILGTLARNNTFDLVDLRRNAWLCEIRLLKDMLRGESFGQIVFEYSIPVWASASTWCCCCMALSLSLSSKSRRRILASGLEARLDLSRLGR